MLLLRMRGSVVVVKRGAARDGGRRGTVWMECKGVIFAIVAIIVGERRLDGGLRSWQALRLAYMVELGTSVHLRHIAPPMLLRVLLLLRLLKIVALPLAWRELRAHIRSFPRPTVAAALAMLSLVRLLERRRDDVLPDLQRICVAEEGVEGVQARRSLVL